MAADRYHLTTFGCQMNEHDSERIEGLLESLGYESAASPGEADLILLNTCSIRESADRRLATQLGNAKRFKAARAGVKIAVGGCWAQSLRQEVFERYGLTYTTGPLPTQVASAWLKIIRLSLPNELITA